MSKVYSNVGYCQCGCEIWIEYLQSGNKWACRFSDNHIQEITHCSDCGRKLYEEDLESK